MKLRNLFVGVFAAIFVVSSAMVMGLATDYRSGSEIYQNAQVLASVSQQAEPVIRNAQEILPTQQVQEDSVKSLPEAVSQATAPVPTEFTMQQDSPKPVESGWLLDNQSERLAEIALENLRGVNPQVIGWIFIPGTIIDYPIVQGEDNQYYLEHTWDGQDSSVGAVFMEATNAADFSDYRTILYAHNLRNGTMFSSLHSYKDSAFWEENPYVYVVTDAGIFRYAIYAAYEADINGATYWRDVDSEFRRQEYVDYGLANSVLDTGIIPTTDTPVLTLSTCTGYTYARRWVVQAVLEGPVTSPKQ